MLEARNAGKAIVDARGEMGMVVDTFRYYAGAPERLLGDTIPVAGGQAFTVREPVGVVGLITPWNFPLTIAAGSSRRRSRPGNTVVLKPAELTPLTALRFAELAVEAGLPEGVVNVVVRARGAPAGSAWSSTPTSRRSPSPARPRSGARSPPGRRRRSSASRSSWAASRPTSIFADADLEAAAAAAPIGGLRQRRAGLLRALADPRAGRGASSASSSCSSRTSEALRVGDPLEEARRWGR